MRTIKTYRKVGAFYIACEEDLSIVIGTKTVWTVMPKIFGCSTPRATSLARGRESLRSKSNSDLALNAPISSPRLAIRPRSKLR